MFNSNSGNLVFLFNFLLFYYFSWAKSQNSCEIIRPCMTCAPPYPSDFIITSSLPQALCLVTVAYQLLLKGTKKAPVTGSLHFLFSLLGKLPLPAPPPPNTFNKCVIRYIYAPPPLHRFQCVPPRLYYQEFQPFSHDSYDFSLLFPPRYCLANILYILLI